MVLQAIYTDKGGGSSEQLQFIIYKMEMLVPYSFYTDYRRKVMYVQVKKDVHEIIMTLYGYKNVKITAGDVSIDHVHCGLSLILSYHIGHCSADRTYVLIFNFYNIDEVLH